MQLSLISSVPSKRWDPHRNLCADGRGGWVFSQVNVDRVIADYSGFYMIFGLGVLASNASNNDYVEQTRLTAHMDDDVIGSCVLTWKQPNAMWRFSGSDAIFEWAQLIDLAPVRDGMITISIDVKTASQDDWLAVDGNAYCRIEKCPESVETERFVGSFWFTIKNAFKKPFWPHGNPQQKRRTNV